MKGKSISQEAIEGFRRTTESNPCHAILQKALVNSGIEAVTMNQQSEINMQYTFSTEIKTGDITHQKSSGRC